MTVPVVKAWKTQIKQGEDVRTFVSMVFQVGVMRGPAWVMEEPQAQAIFGLEVIAALPILGHTDTVYLAAAPLREAIVDLTMRIEAEGSGACAVCQTETTWAGAYKGDYPVWLCPDHGGTPRQGG